MYYNGQVSNVPSIKKNNDILFFDKNTTVPRYSS